MTELEFKIQELQDQNQLLINRLKVNKRFINYAYNANKFICFLDAVTGNSNNKLNCERLKKLFIEAVEFKQNTGIE